jgi:hypothetical protein
MRHKDSTANRFIARVPSATKVWKIEIVIPEIWMAWGQRTPKTFLLKFWVSRYEGGKAL